MLSDEKGADAGAESEKNRGSHGQERGKNRTLRDREASAQEAGPRPPMWPSPFVRGLGTRQRKNPERQESLGVLRGAGGGLLSRDLSIGVPSALQGLTTVFGMGTGVAPALQPPAIRACVL